VCGKGEGIAPAETIGEGADASPREQKRKSSLPFASYLSVESRYPVRACYRIHALLQEADSETQPAGEGHAPKASQIRTRVTPVSSGEGTGESAPFAFQKQYTECESRR
jgi:hypothetical protein